MTFPASFLWGAATSAYQIEGSPLADGAGESIWHRFTRCPANVADGSNGDVACDHYRRFDDDVRLMQSLGLGAYRFSISWSRVLPGGTGNINQRGVDFYRRLVDALLDHGITPMATLYHWDLPMALEEQGGWTNPRIADWFAEYAALMFRVLGDRVPFWTTINEPWVVMHHGYVEGNHAPGRRSARDAALVAKNLLLAHGRAIQIYRARADGRIGLVVNLVPIHSATDSETDRAAANRFDAYLNRHFLDPTLLGQIPNELPDIFGADWPGFSSSELKQIQQPLDFIGINYYLRLVVRDDPSAGLARAQIVPQPDAPHTAMGWEIYPQGLTDTLIWVKNRYGNLPQYITENGAAFNDDPPNGTIADAQRVEYIKRHLQAAEEAIRRGVDLRGYFLWSLFDNFEWACGYEKRFGIVHVNFDTQQRLPKSSAHFYARVIQTGGAALQG